MTKYLNQTRQIIEIGASLVAVGFGLFTIAVISLGLGDPLWWAGLDIPAQNAFALVLVFAGTIHSWGIAINGRWQWSPLLRVIGMTVHAAGISYLVAAIVGSISAEHGIPSGLYQYSVTAGILWYLDWRAFFDLRDSLAITRLCNEF